MRKLVALSLVVLSCWGGVSYGDVLSAEAKKCIYAHNCYGIVNHTCEFLKKPKNTYDLTAECRAAIAGDEVDLGLARMADTCRQQCIDQPDRD